MDLLYQLARLRCHGRGGESTSSSRVLVDGKGATEMSPRPCTTSGSSLSRVVGMIKTGERALVELLRVLLVDPVLEVADVLGGEAPLRPLSLK